MHNKTGVGVLDGASFSVLPRKQHCCVRCSRKLARLPANHTPHSTRHRPAQPELTSAPTLSHFLFPHNPNHFQFSSVEAKVAMLVEAPAAVEDALASLLDHPDPTVQRRALDTYVRRHYYPFLLHEPRLAAAEAPRALLAGMRGCTRCGG
jgi:hypothetical protein